MISNKLSWALVLLSFSAKIISMDGPMHFKFMAFIENNSKNPISYINCNGYYEVSQELDSQEIPAGSVLPIARGEGYSEIFKLMVAGAKQTIINVPGIVFAHLNRPHDPGATKRKSNGYRVKFDNWPPTDDFVPVIQGQCIYVRVDENNAITFEVKREQTTYLPVVGGSPTK